MPSDRSCNIRTTAFGTLLAALCIAAAWASDARAQAGVRHRAYRMVDPSTGSQYAIRELRYIPEQDQGQQVIGDIGIWESPGELFNINFGTCPSGQGCARYAYYLQQKARHNLVLASLASPADPLQALEQIKELCRGPSGEFLFDGFFYDELVAGDPNNIANLIAFVRTVRLDPQLSRCVIAVAAGNNYNQWVCHSDLMQVVQNDVDFWCPETYFSAADSPTACSPPSLASMAQALATKYPLVLEKTIPLLNDADNFFAVADSADQCVDATNYARKGSPDQLSFGDYQSQFVRQVGEGPPGQPVQGDRPLQDIAGIGFFTDRLATQQVVFDTDRSFKDEFLLRIGDQTVPHTSSPTIFNWFHDASAFMTLSSSGGSDRIDVFHAVQSSDHLYTTLTYGLPSVPRGRCSLTFDYRTNYDLPLDVYLGFLNTQTGGYDMASYDRLPRNADGQWHTTTAYFAPCDNEDSSTALHFALSWNDFPIPAGAFIEIRNIDLRQIHSDLTQSIFTSGDTNLDLFDGRLDSPAGVITGGSAPPGLAVRASSSLYPSGKYLAAIVSDPTSCSPSYCDLDYSHDGQCGVWSSLRADVGALPAGHYDLDFWYRASWRWCAIRTPGGTGCIDEPCQGSPWVGIFKPPSDLVAGTRSNFDLARFDSTYLAGNDKGGRLSDGQWHQLHYSFSLANDETGLGYNLHFAEVWGAVRVSRTSSFELDNIELTHAGDQGNTSRVLDDAITGTSHFQQIDAENQLSPHMMLDTPSNSFFPSSQACLAVTPGGTGVLPSFVQLNLTLPQGPGVLAVSLWSRTQHLRGLRISAVDNSGAVLGSRTIGLPGDSTSWHNEMASVAIPEGKQATAIRLDFGAGPGQPADPVYLDELSVFRAASGAPDPQFVAAVGPDGPLVGPIYFLPCVPNPMRSVTRIRFQANKPGKAFLRIVDVQGRTVRSLTDNRLIAGENGLRWDGTDHDGRPVPAGVYFLSVVEGSESASGRVVVIR